MSKKIRVTPGKTQSKAAFVVGIIFCLIGLMVVIPTFGLFGILWTAVAGWGTYVNYRNGFTDKKITGRVIEVETDEHESAVTGTNAEARMKQLQSLYDQALISKEEYEEKRKEILKEL